MRDTEVLIVGAGPTGLVLALLLTRLGVRVRIVDKTAYLVRRRGRWPCTPAHWSGIARLPSLTTSSLVDGRCLRSISGRVAGE